MWFRFRIANYLLHGLEVDVVGGVDGRCHPVPTASLIWSNEETGNGQGSWTEGRTGLLPSSTV